jgi:predicted metal-dependent enzyme (double-stranded beta helix superfamily)
MILRGSVSTLEITASSFHYQRDLCDNSTHAERLPAASAGVGVRGAQLGGIASDLQDMTTHIELLSNEDWQALLAAAVADAAECVRRIAAADTLRQLCAMAPDPGPGHPYARQLVAEHGAERMTLVRWRRGRVCAPHDHGQGNAVTLLLRGQLIERLWRWTGSDLVICDERRAVAPAVLVCDPGEIHDVRSPGGAVTLNLYQGGDGSMRLYDLRQRLALDVRPGVGAWLPVDPAMIVTSHAFPDEEVA